MNSSHNDAGQKASILIVDDMPANLRLLLQMLSSHGYRVHTANSGKAALQFLQSTLPDLILLDIMMPGMDGFEVCERLKAEVRTHDRPVIFISAADQVFDKVRAFKSGAVDYIVKPFEAEEVLARIETHLTLASLRRELERRVDERTAELAETNAQLKLENAERRHAEAGLREREARIRRLVEANIIGVFFWNVSGEIEEANDEFLRIVGHARTELAAGTIRWTDFTPPEWRAADARAIEAARTGNCTSYEKEFVQPNGHRVPVLVGGIFFEGSQTQGVGFVLDLTERKRAEDRIRYIAQHDGLTGLPNRALFQDRVSQAIAQAHRNKKMLGLLFIDLDNFKDINDSLGHQVGDGVLRMVAGRLPRLLREGDTVARLGGDEFVISLPNLAQSDDVALIAEKMLDSLGRPVLVDGHELRVQASIGISLYPIDGQDVETLMQAADTAMYFAKERGRNNYQFFTSVLNDAVRRRLAIANLLHSALDRGEVMLYYQPQVDLVSGRILGAEALARWRQPDMGMIPPSEFIEVAEETGFIVLLGEWVLRQACEQLKRWRNAGWPDLHISVNLSPQQLRRPGFPALAARILQQAGLPASALEMEITEGILMLQSQDNMTALNELAGMGIRLAVDDFGIGYSSLAYLRRFPIHSLKIDQSFVSGIGKDANDAAIVTAIIALAKSLNLGLVAEGVEMVEQVAFLKTHGCMKAQGLYFGPAMAAERFIALLGEDDTGPGGSAIASENIF